MRPEILFPLFAPASSLKGVGPKIAPLVEKAAGPRVRDLLVESGRDDILLTGGGIIPKEDMDALQQRGVARLFGPGTSTQDLVEYIRAWFASRQQLDA